jgi:Ala-tRNA(Pro) deacylase
MLAKSLREYLDQRKIKYLTITHSRAFTAQEVAECAHIPGNILAKTVMVEIDGQMAMAVVPANHRVRLDDLRALIHTDDVRLMREDEFRRHFPDCETGAIPPFSNLYEIPVFVDPELSDQEEIVFNAGSHTEAIRMRWEDFERLVKPRVAKFAK